jgi:putative transposase
MPRGARLDAPGTLHHVIVRGIEKRRIVDDDQDHGMFIGRLGDLSQRLQTAVYAWSLMTNHAHILLRSGPSGLSAFMRKFLTGYAGGYNRRHRRHGHLFQNRYKSIVVEEDAYFKELVRYIHLNPLRAGMVKSMKELGNFPWCGHSVLMGRIEYDWQDTAYVLGCFGKSVRQSRQLYQRFVDQGVAMGRQPHLVGGGLVRSAGGWSEIKALRRIGSREKGDQRILGSGPFVESILSESELSMKYRLANLDRTKAASRLIDSSCRENDVSIEALRGGSRLRPVSRVRCELASRLTTELGLSLTETARLLGVSSSGVAKILSRWSDSKSS